MLGTSFSYDPKYYSTNTFLFVRQRILEKFEQKTELDAVVRFQTMGLNLSAQMINLPQSLIALSRQRFDMQPTQASTGKRNLLTGNGISVPKYEGSASAGNLRLVGTFSTSFGEQHIAMNSPVIRFLTTELDISEGIDSLPVYRPTRQETA